MIINLYLGTKPFKFISSFFFALLLSFQLCIAEQGFIPECSVDKGTPIPEGFPTASTTGVVGAGISYSSLSPYSGTYTINGKNNTVIENLDIKGYMRIMNSSNLTIRNCRIISDGDLFGIRIESSNSMITIENCEIGTKTEGTTVGISALGVGIDSLIIRNCDISGGADGMKVSSNNLIEGNYIHHLCRWFNPEDLGGKGDWTHNDCLQTLGADNVIIRGNTFLAPYKETNSTFQCQTDKGSITNIAFEGNYLSGGGNCLNIREKSGYIVSNMIVRNNVWEDDTFKYGPYVQITNEIPESYGNSFVSGGECDIITGKCVPNVAESIINVSGISIDQSSINLQIGQNSNLIKSITPTNATDKSVSWDSDNSDIATVDANGVVSALSEGQAIITVKTNDGDFTASCKVTVAPNIIAVESISISQTSAELTMGSTTQLTVTITPGNASDKAVSWTSGNPDVATVDANGIVTAVSVGKATITATVDSGSFISVCKVEVSLPNDNTGINNPAQNMGDLLSIYPNPYSGGILHVDLPSGNEAQKAVIKIYDITGIPIFEQTNPGQHHNIKLSFKRGIYVIEVSISTTTNYRKLVVR